MKKFFWASLGIACLLIASVVIRTIRFASRQIQVAPPGEINFDAGAAVKRLSLAIQYKTVSLQNPAEADAVEFIRFHQFLAESFPAVHSQLTKEVVGGYSLLYTWKGKDESLKPLLLMGHMDVVPVDPGSEKNWTYPPFSGQIAGAYIWGRGAMDDKVNVLALLEAVEHLLTTGFQPQRTLYLAFGHDEELGGENGAAKIATLLLSRHVLLEYVLDEGGNITDGVVPGVASPVALIGIAEKGYLSLELKVDSPGGHSSTPPARTAIGVLSDAIHKLGRSPFPSRLPKPTRGFLEFIGPEMNWPEKIIAANLWLFEPLIEWQFAKSPPSNAMIRTTQAATIFQAGVKDNVLPASARAVVNLRLLTGDTIPEVVDRVRRVIDDPQINITQLRVQMEPSPVSEPESTSFRRVQRTVKETMPKALVAPFLLVAATDSRHYQNLTPNIFRFVPFTLRPDDIQRFHGIDERIAVKDYENCVRFFVQLIRNSQF